MTKAELSRATKGGIPAFHGLQAQRRMSSALCVRDPTAIVAVALARALVVSGFAITSAWRTTTTSVTTTIVRQRPDVAVLREATRIIRSGRNGDVTVALRSSELPKALLQPERRFHAPFYFWLVLDLHDAARGRDGTVRVMGAVEVPRALEDALERAEATEQRTINSARPSTASPRKPGIVQDQASS